MLLEVDDLKYMIPDLAESDEDALKVMLQAASDLIEMQLNRKLMLEERVQTRMHSGQVVLLDAYPVKSVQSVKLNGAEVTGWQADAERGIMYLPEPCRGILEITYSGGFTKAPAAIQQACALMVASMIRSAEAGGQAIMSERLGDYQMQFYQSGTEKLSPAAEALIAPYRGRGGVR